MSAPQRLGVRCCNDVFVLPRPLPPEALTLCPCPWCERVGWVIGLPIPGTFPLEVAPVYICYDGTAGAPPWWETPGPLPPPLGTIILARLIPRGGGVERDGWVYLLTCESCGANTTVPYGDALPAGCAACSGALKNTFAVDPGVAWEPPRIAAQGAP